MTEKTSEQSNKKEQNNLIKEQIINKKEEKIKKLKKLIAGIMEMLQKESGYGM